jgi:hypothetical protein
VALLVGGIRKTFPENEGSKIYRNTYNSTTLHDLKSQKTVNYFNAPLFCNAV